VDARTYPQTSIRIIALCLVRSKFGKDPDVHRWRWRGEQKAWKVGLASLSLEGLNLKRLAEDAEVLAKEHRIELSWG
jgi:hypothetical protein